jgi:hypothetical protein
VQHCGLQQQMGCHSLLATTSRLCRCHSQAITDRVQLTALQCPTKHKETLQPRRRNPSKQEGARQAGHLQQTVSSGNYNTAAGTMWSRSEAAGVNLQDGCSSSSSSKGLGTPCAWAQRHNGRLVVVSSH